MSNQNYLNIPTETVTLISQGLPYDEHSLYSKGELEMKYQTAKEEDILTNINYIKNKTVFDKLLQSMIVTNGFKLNDLLVGDKDGLLLDARILGEGNTYTIKYYNPYQQKTMEHDIDLTTIKPFPLHPDLQKGKMEYDFTLPKSKVTLTFQLLTVGLQKEIEKEVEQIENKTGQSPKITTTLRYQIVAINGERDKSKISQFIPNILKPDVKVLLKYMDELEPKLNLSVDITDDKGNIIKDVKIPIGYDFFW